MWKSTRKKTIQNQQVTCATLLFDCLQGRKTYFFTRPIFPNVGSARPAFNYKHIRQHRTMVDRYIDTGRPMWPQPIPGSPMIPCKDSVIGQSKFTGNTKLINVSSDPLSYLWWRSPSGWLKWKGNINLICWDDCYRPIVGSWFKVGR
jgi:hypothetical protein